MNLVRAKLLVDGHTINAHVARNREDRSQGLMHCQNLAESEGMLFVCDRCEVQNFWMKNTLLPLSAAFIGDDGTILKVAEMEPHSLESVSSDHAVAYVLEMRAGWFAERGIGPGSRIEGPVFAAVVAS